MGINIPGFIRLLREGDIAGAYQKIREANWFPSICGRICSSPCELACVLTEENAPIGIRALERFASDHGRSRGREEKPRLKGKKVAVVGAGPSGLTASAELAKKGFQVTIFESQDKLGGVLRYGIPEFRLSPKILDREIEEIISLGIDVRNHFFVGQTASLDELFKEGFQAILLASGAAVPKFADLPGSNLGGVYYGEEFLLRCHLLHTQRLPRGSSPFFLGQKVVVVGSGNTALDCARTAVRLGREVTIIFRRTEDDMGVRKDEREYAKEEGIRFESLVKPIEILPNDQHFVYAVKCVRMDYADSQETGHWQLIPVPDSEFLLEADTVVIAIGHAPNSLLLKEIKLNDDGSIQIDKETGMTSREGVFACGNVVTNAGPVVQALASGKKAAQCVEQYLLK